MAFADDSYTATGADPEDFTVSWGYIEKAHVIVKRNGITLVDDTDYAWTSATNIRFSAATSTNTSGDVIQIFRSTSRGTRLVDYTGTRTTESMLDQDSLQAFYMAQEAIDTLTASQAGLESTDDGSSAGPTFFLWRNSASPAASDKLGKFLWQAEDDAGAQVNVAGEYAEYLDPAAASLDAKLVWETVLAGTMADRLHLGAGLWTQGATGGDKGVGTINASNFYIGGTALAARNWVWTGTHEFDSTAQFDAAVTANAAVTVNADLTVNSTNLTVDRTGGTGVLTVGSDGDSGAFLGVIGFRGHNSVAANYYYAKVWAGIADNTDGSEDGYLYVQTSQAGVDVTVAQFRQGFYMQGATGGDQGTDTINASAYYVDGAELFAKNNVWGGTALWDASTQVPVELRYTSASGATTGPILKLRREVSGTAAINDSEGAIWFVRDGGNLGCSIEGLVTLMTPGVGASRLQFTTQDLDGSGTAAKMYLGDGLYFQGTAGGDKGVETVNATTYYTSGGPSWSSGTGSPEGVVTATVGSLYSRTDGGASTSLYVKESGAGNTGWVAK